MAEKVLLGGFERLNLQDNENRNSNLSLKVLIMNSDNSDHSKPERRRQKIQSIVEEHQPELVLFQEFPTVNIARDKDTWIEHPLPEQYIYTGHKDASIMFDSRLLAKVERLPASKLDAIVTYLQSNQNNRLQTPFPTDFNPISKMCARVISTAAKPSFELICISWHGPYKVGRGRRADQNKIDYFKYLMEFFRNIREKFKHPILVAGDFNIAMDEIKQYIRSPFNLCEYEASERRTEQGIIDFCIFTDDLRLEDTRYINLERNDIEDKLFDHDPIITLVKASTSSTT